MSAANYPESDELLSAVFALQDDGYVDEISANLEDQVLIQYNSDLNEQMLISDNILQELVLIHDDYSPNPAAGAGAINDCSDLEEVLDFLLEEIETSPADISLFGNYISSGLDTICGITHDLNNISGFEGPVVPNPVVLGGDPSSFESLEVGGVIKMREGEEVIRASWQQQTQGESWQQKEGEARAISWWQQKEGHEIRASWQQEQGAVRASWQLQREKERCSSRGAGEASSEERGVIGPEGSTAIQNCSTNSFKSSRKAAVWAGPTLLDIETALAKSTGSPTDNDTMIAASSTHDSSTDFLDVQQQLLTDEVAVLCKAELQQADKLSNSWRLRLQKRSHLGPKYTVKVRSEEDAASDGYRWRKYGQKSIKNSPFPRSYYRCSTGKCIVKKKVERSNHNAGLFLVTYEGLHLHHRPNP